MLTRVQYSVFECQLTDTQYEELRSRLSKLIKPEDNIRFIPSALVALVRSIGLADRRRWIGPSSLLNPILRGGVGVGRGQSKFSPGTVDGQGFAPSPIKKRAAQILKP
ncbi:CRISPR-associated endonuclease Cas2 [[Phormidium] sp. ETS-05]|uniref:CRISPR-associated endonuclease Cas2 n=1 Tax=[Phormidium] sp. ETS-05 TaxID=222819 RepID=UPI0031FEB2FC